MKKAKRQAISHPDRHWEVRDAMHTMLRAGEIVRDKGLLKEVKKAAAQHAQESADVAKRAEILAKSGRISPKAMSKMVA